MLPPPHPYILPSSLFVIFYCEALRSCDAAFSMILYLIFRVLTWVRLDAGRFGTFHGCGLRACNASPYLLHARSKLEGGAKLEYTTLLLCGIVGGTARTATVSIVAFAPSSPSLLSITDDARWDDSRAMPCSKTATVNLLLVPCPNV